MSSSFVSRIAFTLLCIFVSATFCASVTAINPPIRANLRIEGANSTIFEGHIFTRGHDVTTASGGTHSCDGTNNQANPLPGATCTTALADAAKKKYFPFDGTFDPEFDDFFITSIGDSTETSTEFWGLLLNFQFTPVGGCQQEVNRTDKVLWAFNAFNKQHFLSLSGPTTARVHQPVIVTVIDGSTNVPIQNASVGGQLTDANGHATLIFNTAGTRTLKAERDDSIRSNALQIDVKN